MSDIDTMLAEVRRLNAEATRGEWRTEPDPGYECDECGERDEQAAIVRAASGAGICVVLVGDRADADAALIAYYRTAAPLLAAEVERLRAELDSAKADHTRTYYALQAEQADCKRLRAEVETATAHARALVAAMAEWGSWEDGVPAAGDSGCGKVGDAYDAAKAYLAVKGAER